MKQVKYKNVIFTNGYDKALNKLADQPIGIAKEWVLAKFVKQFVEKNKIFEEQRVKIAKKYGKLSKDGQQYSFEGKNRELFLKELQQLLDIEETYDVEEIKVEEGMGLSTNELILLEDILVQ